MVRVSKQMLTIQNSRRQNEEITMSDRPTEPKRLLSHVIAEWACALKSEHLSPAAIQAAKLFWFDSIGSALGGSQQDDVRILLRHYRALSGGRGDVNAFAWSGLCHYRPRGRSGPPGACRIKYPESPIAVKL